MTVNCSPALSIELQAVCEKGSFTIKDYGLWYGPKENENEKTLLIKDKRLPGEKTYYGSGHVDLIRRFYDMLEGKTDQYFSVKDDKVSLLIEGIRKSSLESRIVEWKELDKNE